MFRFRRSYIDIVLLVSIFIYQGGSGGFGKASVSTGKTDSKLTKAAQDWYVKYLHFTEPKSHVKLTIIIIIVSLNVCGY